MIRVEDAIGVYRILSDHDIQVWLTGGWGIDALLQEQTRPHQDFDILMLVEDVVRMQELLGGAGYGLKELWSENRVAAPRAPSADKISGNGYTDLHRLDSLGAIQANHLQVIASRG